MTAVDYDTKALKLAQSYAQDLGLNDSLLTIRNNILHPEHAVAEPHLSELRGTADVVDAVGIVEYLQPEDKTYRYNGVMTSRPKQAGALTLLKNCYELVRPGGILLFGNMSPRHPQIGFMLNVIQWPHIVPRLPEEMLEICDAGGLSGDMTIHYPGHHVYPMYALREPE